ncbi:uncharacterized protein METZ01_LOCUS26626 [marine metagenome]|uniref:Uncharacterized protein n=1 Tax=marine metagenome TaxID=408172 RepID=A0A381Q380_9ZZZZ
MGTLKSLPAPFLTQGQTEGGILKGRLDAGRIESTAPKRLQYNIRPLCCVTNYNIPLYIVDHKLFARLSFSQFLTLYGSLKLSFFTQYFNHILYSKANTLLYRM